jgi:hypothetical protein
MSRAAKLSDIAAAIESSKKGRIFILGAEAIEPGGALIVRECGSFAALDRDAAAPILNLAKPARSRRAPAWELRTVHTVLHLRNCAGYEQSRLPYYG